MGEHKRGNSGPIWVPAAAEAQAAGRETSEIPTYIRETILASEDIEHYTQCIINAYEAQNEIPWHLDHKYFGDKVLVYTFGEERPLLLRKQISFGSIGLQQPEEEYTFHITQAYPRHCSKYILQGSARNEWEHLFLPEVAREFQLRFVVGEVQSNERVAE